MDVKYRDERMLTLLPQPEIVVYVYSNTTDFHLPPADGFEAAQAANARGPISNKEEVADSFQACSVCIMEYFHPPDVLI